MLYDIRLRISYDYPSAAVGGRHVLCVQPADLPGEQRLILAATEVQPRPDERLDWPDFFGNRLAECSFRNPHKGLTIVMKARVERLGGPRLPDPDPRLEDLAAALAACNDLGPGSPLHFLSATPRVPRNRAMTRFAEAALRPGMGVAAATLAIGRAVHGRMTFDASATHVDTPAAEAFSRRHGVCQDFSHILIACLRGVGIPAGYVSGFLRTLPPEGKARLEGADAMHAWVRAWCGPAAGWIEYDPTNDTLAGGDHIVVARGRDYSDVAPIKGVLRVAGAQKSSQSVDVVPAGG